VKMKSPRLIVASLGHGSSVLRRRHLVIVGVSLRINGGFGLIIERGGGVTLTVKLYRRIGSANCQRCDRNHETADNAAAGFAFR